MRPIIRVANKLFGFIYDKNKKSFKELRELLQKADITIPVRSYVSLSIFISFIVFLISLFLIPIFLNFFSFPFYLRLSISTFAPISLAILVFALLIFYPYHKASKRAKDIESNLPFALTHMGAIAEAGVPPYVIFKLISRFREYGEISREMKKITKNIEVLGLDTISAVKRVARRTPSDKFRQILEGIVTTTESGGNIAYFLKSVGQQSLFEWRLKRQRFIQQLSTYAEIYTGILVAAPLFVISLLSVLSLIQPNLGGYDILTLAKFAVYGLIPALNLGFLIFLKLTEVEI